MVQYFADGSCEEDADADVQVKVSSNDTTANYLENKLVAGSNVTLTVNNEGADETITIASSGGGGGGTDDQISTEVPHTATGWTSGANVGAQLDEIVANGPQNKLDAAVPPTVSNDDTEGYSPGSMWIDVTHQAAWWCKDASTGAAVWVAFRKATVQPTLAPGVGDDIDDGWSVGDFWYEEDAGRIWLCYRNDAGNAGWANMWPDVDNFISTITTNTEANIDIVSNNIDFAIPFYASDAEAEAAGVGNNTDGPIEFYWNTVTRQVRYGWNYVSGGGIPDPENPGPSAGVQWGGLTYPRGKAGSNPGTGDDADDGWEEGALWQNTLSGDLLHLRDSTVAAAVWGQLLELISGSLEERLKFANDGAFQFPTVAASSPTTGDTRENSGYLERYDSTTWQKVAALVNNWAATAAPTTSNDNTQGYVVGSRWGDVTNDKTYEAIDVSTGAAIWKETSAAGGGSSQLERHAVVSADFDSGSWNGPPLAGNIEDRWNANFGTGTDPSANILMKGMYFPRACTIDTIDLDFHTTAGSATNQLTVAAYRVTRTEGSTTPPTLAQVFKTAVTHGSLNRPYFESFSLTNTSFAANDMLFFAVQGSNAATHQMYGELTIKFTET